MDVILSATDILRTMIRNRADREGDLYTAPVIARIAVLEGGPAASPEAPAMPLARRLPA